MSIELLLSIGAMAILDTLSPATLAVTVYTLLTAKERMVRRLLTYLMTVAVFYFTVGVLLMLGLDAIFESFSRIFENKIINWGLLIVGGILFIWSFFIPTKKTSQPRRPKSMSMGAMVGLGLTTSLIEVATALPYFAAIGIMTAAQLSIFQWLPLIAGYNLIMVLPPLILLGLHLVLGKWMKGHLEKLQDKLAQNSGSALSWVMSIVGIIMVLFAMDHLE